DEPWLRFDPAPNRKPFPAPVSRISGTGTGVRAKPSPPVADGAATRSWSRLPHRSNPEILHKPGSILELPLPLLGWAAAAARLDANMAPVRVCAQAAWDWLWVAPWKKARLVGPANASVARSRPATQLSAAVARGSGQSALRGFARLGALRGTSAGLLLPSSTSISHLKHSYILMFWLGPVPDSTEPLINYQFSEELGRQLFLKPSKVLKVAFDIPQMVRQKFGNKMSDWVPAASFSGN